MDTKYLISSAVLGQNEWIIHSASSSAAEIFKGKYGKEKVSIHNAKSTKPATYGGIYRPSYVYRGVPTLP